jgi:RimJ/RimL family protein N-acetyltransferase
MAADEQLRFLIIEDIPSAMELSAEANWNQTPEDWQMLIELAPEGCLAIEVEGEIAATTTVLFYGQRLAWIGMVLTRMKFRGQGLARRLLAETLTLCDRMKVETVKLDATDQGKPLYEKLGFRVEQAAERWLGPCFSNAMKSSAQSPEVDSIIDLEAFGADRSALLRKLGRRNPPLCHEASYVFTRPGRQKSYLGPCVCRDSYSARRLLQRAGQTNNASCCFWDLLPENQDAVAIARELGFSQQRHLFRMVRGRDLRGKEQAIYAIAGFELG